ncbi:Protein OSB4, chloroplastic [Vitis vinifera]|uniref:Protein OSB4, chloroplastic n=1 Tax=Vitis vinifera TaxID=29760 RepID=A0A438GWX8_VITVI|nr:Protein OSB4, chloroplastic [Vitis vinifera]
MNSLSRTFVKLLSSSSTRNRVLLPLLTTLNQSSSSSSSSSLFCHFTAAASTQKYPSRKYKAAQQSSSLLSASVIEPSAEDHPRDRGAPSGDWPRPSEIPWQAKVCNSVNLIGKVHAPVQFQQSSDGKCWAVTVIAQDADAASHSPALW